MNRNKERKDNIFSKTLYGIKSWSVGKKRIFSLSIALFLTVLIIVLNSAISVLRGDDNKIVKQNNSLIAIQKSFSEIFTGMSSTIEQVSSNTATIIEQINSTSSSLSTTTNIVE